MRRTALVVLVLVAACSTNSTSTPGASSKLKVVASTSAWGSLAAQVGGDLVEVTSIVSNPDADPHDYEPTAEDARTISTAQYVIFNGVGYDEWARNVVESNANKSQVVLDVGAAVGVHGGDNPHRWYFPNDVRTVIDRMVADFERIDPANAPAFEQRKADFESQQFKRYRDALDAIRGAHANTPVGASESLFVGIAEATGLIVLTPNSFVTAISEGIDPSLQDKTTAEQQVATKSIKVLVFNPQNSTPDVSTLVDTARANGIPVVEFTETLVGATFIDWQVAQLQRLADALGP
ncbi:MAG: zinc/manganese transport system substrate-binding protein [Acidimicrobiaceae bacterium]|jgi:zinc/manganese transport system substrate-binding protein